MNRTITLVRHPPVAEQFRSLCYGSSDVPLGSDGTIQQLVEELAALPITHVYHSGLTRAATVADLLGARIGVVPIIDTRLRERHFGEWEMRPWQAIYDESADDMMGMVHDPAEWRPPGGETTFSFRDRVMEWYRDLPDAGHIAAICHGGPIAALLGTLRDIPVSEWLGLIPPPGEIVTIN
jgi:alpha-ribazole phosphatase